MNTATSVKNTQLTLYASLTLGLILLAIGILLEVMDSHVLPNNKALVGLSLIPLAAALASYVKLRRIRKSPEVMKDIMIAETDERLKALRNEADANAFRILQAILFLAYMGYTLMIPADVFEAVGWWILMCLLLTAFILQGVLLARALSKDKADADRTEANNPLAQ